MYLPGVHSGGQGTAFGIKKKKKSPKKAKNQEGRKLPFCSDVSYLLVRGGERERKIQLLALVSHS